MKLSNTSRYGTDEVRHLVEFGMKGINTTGLAVHVKNSTAAYAGMAYESVPFMSSEYGKASVTRLVTLRIGPADKFPCNNVVTKRVPLSDWLPHEAIDRELEASVRERYGATNFTYNISTQNGVRRFRLYGLIEQPYGGSRSPLIEVKNWREGLVVIAAHEGRHIYQYQHNKRRSEVDAEKFAYKRLLAYRSGLEAGVSTHE